MGIPMSKSRSTDSTVDVSSKRKLHSTPVSTPPPPPSSVRSTRNAPQTLRTPPSADNIFFTSENQQQTQLSQSIFVSRPRLSREQEVMWTIRSSEAFDEDEE